MILFMWQNDIIGVAHLIDACLGRVYTSAGPPVGARHLISPELAEIDVTKLLLLLAPICRAARAQCTALHEVDFLNSGAKQASAPLLGHKESQRLSRQCSVQATSSARHLRTPAWRW